MGPPSRPLAEGTSPEAEALLIEHDRRLEVHERIAISMDLTRLADETALEAIRLRHPNASEREQKLRLAALEYGRDLVPAAYGWDALVEGWSDTVRRALPAGRAGGDSEHVGLRFVVGVSLAGVAWGGPRSIHDVDLLVGLPVTDSSIRIQICRLQALADNPW